VLDAAREHNRAIVASSKLSTWLPRRIGEDLLLGIGGKPPGR